MGDGYDWFLWKRRVYDSSVRFLHRDDLPKCGFTSVYAVTEGVAQSLQAVQDYSGFRGEVWSDKLWIDCDTEESAALVEEGLKKEGLAYEKWTTGNRGCHFGIARHTKPDRLLPMRDKAWVNARFGDAPDLKLYSHLHLFRVPGEIHDKTGNRKQLLYRVDGTALNFETDAPTITEPERTVSETRNAETSVFEDVFIMSWSTPQENGERNKALSSVAYRLADRGESIEFARGWLENMNLLYHEPKPAEEIEKILKYAFRRGQD